MLCQRGDLTSIINEKGCLMAGEEWLGDHVIVVAGVAVGIAFLQVCDVFLFFLKSQQLLYNWIPGVTPVGI